MLGLGESAAEAPPAPEQPAARPPAAPPEPAPVPMAETPAAPPVTPAPVAPAAAPARPAAESEAPIYTGNEVLDMFVRQLEADPQNHVLRLAIARVGAQASMDELAFQHYRDLIKRGALLDDVVADLSDLIAEGGDDRVLRRLHKTLGDAYSKQGRFNEAVTEYSWTSSGPRSTK